MALKYNTIVNLGTFTQTADTNEKQYNTIKKLQILLLEIFNMNPAQNSESVIVYCFFLAPKKHFYPLKNQQFLNS